MRQKDLYETAKFQHVDWSPILLSSKITYWGDAANLATVTKNSSDQVTELRCSANKGITATPSTASESLLHKFNGTEYNLGTPSFENPDTATIRWLRTSTNGNIRHVFTVQQYKTGVETSAPNNKYIFGISNSSTTVFLVGSYSRRYDGDAWLNGSKTALTDPTNVLPMKTSIIHYKRSSTTSNRLYFGGMTGIALYNLERSIYEIIIFGSELTSVEIEQVEGYLAHKYNIQHRLVNGHPYRERPPTC